VPIEETGRSEIGVSNHESAKEVNEKGSSRGGGRGAKN